MNRVIGSADKDDPYYVSRHAESKMVMKLTKLAEKNCSSLIRAFNECARGRTVSVLFMCRGKYNESQDCTHVYVNDANLALVKQRWVDGGRQRQPNWDHLLAGMDVTLPPNIAAKEAAAKTILEAQVASDTTLAAPVAQAATS